MHVDILLSVVGVLNTVLIDILIVVGSCLSYLFKQSASNLLQNNCLMWEINFKNNLKKNILTTLL